MRWWTFIQERFEPFSHGLMLGCLFLANYGISTALSGIRPGALVLSLLVFLQILFFFHLRLFDEVKDYTTDLEINKTRPLPRGLISLSEFKRVLWTIVGVEFLSAGLLSLRLKSELPFMGYSLASLYSILMYHEFFIGPWLRPKMEAYAISHTFVSGLFAGFIFETLHVGNSLRVPSDLLWLILLNWMVFNVFEFARKTFAKSEERLHVESYSLRLTSFGAVAVTLGFVVLAFLSVMKINQHIGFSTPCLVALIAVSSLVALAGLVYTMFRTSVSGKLFRGASAAYLILFNLFIFIGTQG